MFFVKKNTYICIESDFMGVIKNFKEMKTALILGLSIVVSVFTTSISFAQSSEQTAAKQKDWEQKRALVQKVAREKNQQNAAQAQRAPKTQVSGRAVPAPTPTDVPVSSSVQLEPATKAPVAITDADKNKPYTPKKRPTRSR